MLRNHLFLNSILIRNISIWNNKTSRLHQPSSPRKRKTQRKPHPNPLQRTHSPSRLYLLLHWLCLTLPRRARGAGGFRMIDRERKARDPIPLPFSPSRGEKKADPLYASDSNIYANRWDTRAAAWFFFFFLSSRRHGSYLCNIVFLIGASFWSCILAIIN